MVVQHVYEQLTTKGNNGPHRIGDSTKHMHSSLIGYTMELTDQVAALKWICKNTDAYLLCQFPMLPLPDLVGCLTFHPKHMSRSPYAYTDLGEVRDVQEEVVTAE